MAPDLRPYLEDLEQRIDPQVEADLFFEWKQFCLGKATEYLFTPHRRRPAAPPPPVAPN